MDADRFHRAARDGHLDLLQEANRKELNCRDEDGMTPAMWAAYTGHLDALRLIVGRGGDPDKSDRYGNTSLHCAAGNGHSDCVSFLVHFGVNLWALDNDFHSPKDVAVLNQRNDVLRMLDAAQSRHALVNRKLVQRLKEKSVDDAERRVKRWRKLQRKQAKRAEKEEKERAAGRKENRPTNAPRFSDLVNSGERRVRRSVLFRPGDTLRREGETDIRTRSDQTKEADDSPDRAGSDGQSSDDTDSDVLQTADSGIGDEIPDGRVSIFDRPGFGTVSFRNSVLHLAATDNDRTRHLVECRSAGGAITDSIGSASSLVRRHITWEDECDEEEEEEDEDSEEDEDLCIEEEGGPEEPLVLLLAAVGLADYLPLFRSERIDLEALSLLSEEDLKALGMPLGPRRKLGRALQERLRILQEPGAAHDSPL